MCVRLRIDRNLEWHAFLLAGKPPDANTRQRTAVADALFAGVGVTPIGPPPAFQVAVVEGCEIGCLGSLRREETLVGLVASDIRPAEKMLLESPGPRPH